MSITSFLSASESRIYLGCGNKGDEPSGIFLTSFNSETGILQPAKRVATLINPSFLTFSPNGETLYSVAESAEGMVVAWKVATDGSLTELNRQPTSGADPCHLAMSANGRVLLVANYSGGSIASFPIEKDGSLSPHISFHQFTGSGPNPQRQTAPHAHGIYRDPTGQRVYVPDLGTDRVWIFHFDSSTGNLTPNEIPFATLPPGSGPRHLAFSPDAGHAYVNGEMGLGITVFSHNLETGALESGSTLPGLPEGIDPGQNPDTAEILIHPNGKILYLSTRGYNSISSFVISETGTLSFLENVALPVQGPRHFSLSPDGKWLIVAGQKSQQVTVFSIETTGKILPTGHLIDANAPMCAVFAPGA